MNKCSKSVAPNRWDQREKGVETTGLVHPPDPVLLRLPDFIWSRMILRVSHSAVGTSCVVVNNVLFAMWLGINPRQRFQAIKVLLFACHLLEWSLSEISHKVRSEGLQGLLPSVNVTLGKLLISSSECGWTLKKIGAVKKEWHEGCAKSSCRLYLRVITNIVFASGSVVDTISNIFEQLVDGMERFVGRRYNRAMPHDDRSLRISSHFLTEFFLGHHRDYQKHLTSISANKCANHHHLAPSSPQYCPNLCCTCIQYGSYAPTVSKKHNHQIHQCGYDPSNVLQVCCWVECHVQKLEILPASKLVCSVRETISTSLPSRDLSWHQGSNHFIGMKNLASLTLEGIHDFIVSIIIPRHACVWQEDEKAATGSANTSRPAMSTTVDGTRWFNVPRRRQPRTHVSFTTAWYWMCLLYFKYDGKKRASMSTATSARASLRIARSCASNIWPSLSPTACDGFKSLEKMLQQSMIKIFV